MQPGEFAEYVIIGQSDDYFLIASDKAYGFICKYEDILTRLKGGRALVSLDEGAKLFTPVRLNDKASDLLAVASRQGKLLIYKAEDLPVLPRGKGNKLISIAGAKLDMGIDGVAAVAVIPEGASMIIHCGKRILNLSASEIADRLSVRTKRGDTLPRGFQKVDYIEVVKAKSDSNEEEKAVSPI